MTYEKLRKEYEKRGLNLVWNKRCRKYFLTIANAPLTVKGITNPPGTCQLTGHYVVYYKSQLLDVERMAEEVFATYRELFRDNPVMLSYVP
jgi:hypothetical protein